MAYAPPPAADDAPTGVLPPPDPRYRPNGGGLSRLVIGALWLLAVAAMFVVAAQTVVLEAQLFLAIIAGLALLALYTLKPTGFWRILLIAIVAFVSIRYMTWRTLYTIPPIDSSGFIPGILLYLAELQGFLILMLGIFVNIRPIERPAAPQPETDDGWPTVDVMVPSYNEDPELLRQTLAAAVAIDYPSERLAVHLLDDGGTDEKCEDADPRAAEGARERRETLQQLCAQFGVNYHTRARNIGAKAGNINDAMPNTNGELILILDADHIPTQDILKRTVGHFLDRPDLFLVQTPHFFHTPDPIERNLDTFEKMPGEQEMFYTTIQKGLDSWNATFFCGSAAVLRRACLEEVGGISKDSITEDALTALNLHARGYSSVYVDRPMVAGLAPDTIEAFVTQRVRWSQGMAQILILNNPLLKRGLSLPQRLCYLNSSIFWLFPFARLVFLIAPLFFLFFGLQIFESSLEEFIAFALLHVLCSLSLSNFLFGRQRWPFVSELYELVQSPFVALALLDVVRSPRRPQFKVTPKNQTVDRDFVPDVARPFFIMLGILAVAFLLGLWRLYTASLEREHLIIVFFWNLVNLVLMLGAAGVMYERATNWVGTAVRRDKAVNVIGRHGAVRGWLTHVSPAVARIEVDPAAFDDLETPEDRVIVQTAVPGRDDLSMILAGIQGRRGAGDTLVLDLAWLPRTTEDESDLTALSFGESEHWVRFLAGRERRRNMAAGLGSVGMLGGRRLVDLANRRRTPVRIEPVARQAAVQQPGSA
ncbi:MAG: UDP-forming cellulose synthase catalytic subunit [Deinococcus-Thermus bacterium]|jgi:cellulose synthase (UDP-forming)|nr:UDP-forming cellulose synthase catalytic subunit [Deinococcota bacterium]